MSTAWYKRVEKGWVGMTYPINWKGWLHLLINFAVPIGYLGYAMNSGLWNGEPFLSVIGFFVSFLAIAAVGWAKTDYPQSS